MLLVVAVGAELALEDGSHIAAEAEPAWVVESPCCPC